MSDRQLRILATLNDTHRRGASWPRAHNNRDITILQRNFRAIFAVGSLTGGAKEASLV
jgi:hypothetical protein